MTKLIAKTDITVARGVTAFRAGDVVPESVVENLGIRDLVVGEKTQTAAAVRTPATTEAPKPK